MNDGVREPRHPLEDTGRSLRGGDGLIKRSFEPFVIDYSSGKVDHIDEFTAVGVREEYSNGIPEDVIAIDFGITEDEVAKIVNGDIWPYAGGKLKPLYGRGPNVTNGYTANQRKFIKGVIGLANDLFSPSEFAILCSFISMTVDQAREISRNLEDLDGRLVKQRFRSVLRLHAEGSELEKAFVAVTGKTRSPKRE